MSAMMSYYVAMVICDFKSHEGKYDRATDQPRLAMLAADVGYRYWTDDRSRLE